MALGPDSIVNFSSVNVAVIDGNAQGLEIMSQILAGFGVRNIVRCTSGAEAQEILNRKEVELVVADAALKDMEGSDLVRWMRRCDIEANRTTPVLLVSGHTPLRKVLEARDCGAHYVLAKPLKTQVVLDRILWLARDQRAFVTSPTYCGPDRRWRNLGPPSGTKGRRSTDLSAKVGAATDPNMDQSDIDALFKPMRVTIEL